MSRHAVRARPGENRATLYDEIIDKIIAELEPSRVSRFSPGGAAAAKAPLAMSQNARTAAISGVNVLILWGAVIERGFSGQNWLTFRQALSLGGPVRKGERGTTVVYADRFIPNDEKRRAAKTGEDAQAVPFLKRFTVFNTDQCENLPAEIATAALRRSVDGHQLELFRARPGEMPPRDAQDLMSRPFFSLAKTLRVRPIDFQLGDVTIIVEATHEHGMVTIWDADVLNWAASQIVDARDRGLRTSCLMAATPYEILSFIGRGFRAELRAPECWS